MAKIQRDQVASGVVASTGGAASATCQRTVRIERGFDAPRQTVFSAWTDPKQLVRWWGPKGFTDPVCQVDPRVGGSIRIVMRGPNGINYPMKGVFEEITPPVRIRMMCGPVDENDNFHAETHVTITFEEQGQKTRLVLEVSAVGFTEASKAMLAGMEIGWSQSLERLGSLVGGGDPQ